MIFDYISNASGLPFTQNVYHDFTPELQWTASLSVSLLLTGTVKIHYKNHDRSFGTHDIFFFDPFETFSFVESSEDACVLNISIDADFISAMCPGIQNIGFSKSHITCNYSDAAYVRICRDIAVIVFNNISNEPTSKLKLLGAAADIASAIIDTYGVKRGDYERKHYITKRIMDTLQFINRNYQHHITMEDAAEALNLHPQYFSSFFQKTFGIKFSDFLRNYRVNHSLTQLIYTDDPVIDIAMDNGFASHKTFGMAFKQIYGVNPTTYRKEFGKQESLRRMEGSTEVPAHTELFSFLRQFSAAEPSGAEAVLGGPKLETSSFDVEALSRKSYFASNDIYISVGRAFACLRSEVQAQVRQAKEELNFKYLRIRDIFSDDLYIYLEDENRGVIYNWQSLNSVLDFILSVGAVPFPEIGFMPTALASKKQYSGWQYHPNVSAPKDMKKWQSLVVSFLTNCVDRYGIEEVRKWPFDFWTCPDLKIKQPYWNESMEDFFKFYKATYDAFKSVDKELRLGTPNFSAMSGFPWYEAFFSFCYVNKIYPSHVSSHIYGCEPKVNDGSIESHYGIEPDEFKIDNQNLIAESLEKIHEIMNRSGFRTLDVIVSDCNLTFFPMDLVRDTCYMGPYICHTLTSTLRLAKGICFWSLSDIHEDFFPDAHLFRGGPGLLDYHSVRKASYNAMLLVSKLGPAVLSRGKGYILTQNNDGYQLLLYNLAKPDFEYFASENSVLNIRSRYNVYADDVPVRHAIIMNLKKGFYYVKRRSVNRDHGSAYDLWMKMGFPETLNIDMENYLRSASVPEYAINIYEVESTLVLEEEVPAHGVTLLEIQERK